MAWVKANINLSSAATGTGVKVTLRKKGMPGAKMIFSINAAAAKLMNLADKDKLEVMLGTADHHGLLRVRKNNSAGEAVVTKRENAKYAWWMINLGHQPAFVDRAEANRWCQWKMVEEGWVEITLPKWAAETGTKQRTETALPNMSTGMKPGRTVTAGLMGDPPPGRREMLERIGKVT